MIRRPTPHDDASTTIKERIIPHHPDTCRGAPRAQQGGGGGGSAAGLLELSPEDEDEEEKEKEKEEDENDDDEEELSWAQRAGLETFC